MILYCNECTARTSHKGVWSEKKTDAYGYMWVVFQCDECKEYVFAFANLYQKDTSVRYPFEKSETLPLEGVPKNIMEDYEEASRCLAANAYKGCVSMCRRVLQGAAIDKGADEKGRIIDQLKILKNNQTLLLELYDMATRIRLVGKKGAHPRKLLDKVTEKEAVEMIDFTAQVLNYLYTIRHRIKEHDKRSDSKKN